MEKEKHSSGYSRLKAKYEALEKRYEGLSEDFRELYERKEEFREKFEQSERGRMNALSLFEKHCFLVTWLEPRLGFLYRWYYRKHKKDIEKGIIYD